MELKIMQSPEVKETRITIECQSVTQNLRHIINVIQNMETFIIGYQEKSSFKIPVDSILYIESIENRTFLYTRSDTFDSRQRLYELEKKLADLDFIRISKNTIVNLHQIEQVRSIGISKLELVLVNKERLIVNRNYLYNFKQKFMD
ncbi:LytTR family DNA-binding domain-containing protein [Clostridium sp. AN503]|uniref:LytTR family DNA-binding domain-containing protein n=1 Tax=Clostridium sp. AN503 TaxID=3160598 RepID=UPI00345933CA